MKTYVLTANPVTYLIFIYYHFVIVKYNAISIRLKTRYVPFTFVTRRLVYSVTPIVAQGRNNATFDIQPYVQA